MAQDDPEPPDSTAPSTIDATPGGSDASAAGDDGATAGTGEGTTPAYGADFLEAAGHLDEPGVRETTYAPGRRVRYAAALEGKRHVGYFEVSTADLPPGTPARIVRGLARRTRLQYFWFRDPTTDRVRVFRTAGRPAQFRFDPTVHGPDRRERLDRAASDLDALFDRSDVVERVANDLRACRTALARTLDLGEEGDAAPEDRLRAAQRLLDRLLYCYLLVAGDVVVPIDESGAPKASDPDEVFRTLVPEGDVPAAIDEITGALHAPERAIVRLAGDCRLRVPFLGADDRPSPDDSVGGRRDDCPVLSVEGFDWEGLLDRLDAYRWRLSEVPWADGRERAIDPDSGTVGTITPAVLGDCGERFVRDLAADRTGEIPSETGTDPDPGARVESDDRGVYYTDERIADFVARRALWEALREAIEADLAAGTAPTALESTPLYRPERDRRPGIEAHRRDGFDALYGSHRDDDEVLAYVDATLRDLTVCDPAVGSGSFLLAIADVCFAWRSTCRPDADAAVLRREIVADVLAGVDVRADVAARCRRRLRCWLLAATPADRESVAARSAIPALSIRRIGIRSRNSLLGVTDPDALPAVESDDEGATRVETSEYGALRAALDDRYAATRRDPETGSPLRFEDPVDTAEEAAASLRTSAGDATLCVEVESGIPDPLDVALNAIGFATYTYRARLDRPLAASTAFDEADLVALFDLLDDRIADRDAWSIVVEREYAGGDVGPEGLDACHWPLEFPRTYDGGFDAVVSNPPYGGSLPAEAGPLVRESGEYDCQGASDTCEWFVERLLELTGERGVVAAVVPKSLAFYGSWSDVRELVLAETTLTHVLDVGLGFAGVTYETIALVARCEGAGWAVESEPGTGAEDRDDSADPIGPAVHRSRDRRDPTANEPVHLGRVPTRYARDAGTIVLRPITDDQRAVLDRILAADRRLGEVMSTDETARQLYVPDARKATLSSGPDPFVERVPWVGPYHLRNVRYADLDDYADEVERYAVPRVMLKVLRGSRLRAWLDPLGAIVGTEKLVNVPLADRTGREIAFVYAVCNHPFASFYLQKTVFSETTETARVLDGQYSRPIPVPDPGEDAESAVARLAWTLTVARQVAVDRERGAIGAGTAGPGDPALEETSDDLQRALEALVAACYLDRDDLRDRWIRDLDRRGPSEAAVESPFEAFYADRYASRDGDPEAALPAIRDAIDRTTAVIDEWDLDRVHESREMAVVRDVLE